MHASAPHFRAILVIPLIGLSALLSQGCAGYTCEPRAFTPTGNTATDVLGTWDWSIEGLRTNGDNWTYTFLTDGGVSILHDWTSSPVVATAPYEVVDGGVVLNPGPTPRALSLKFEQNRLLAKEFTADFLPHAALTCRGVGFTP